MEGQSTKAFLLESLLPVDVWNFIVVALILFGVVVALLKGIAFMRDEFQKHKDRKKINTKDITDEIADKVFEKVKPQIDEKFDEFSKSFDKKFEDIDTKLSSDKETLTSHTTQLNEHEARVSKLEGGDKSLCQGMLALLEQNPSLGKQTHAMQNYLITGKYNEEDWQ